MQTGRNELIPAQTTYPEYYESQTGSGWNERKTSVKSREALQKALEAALSSQIRGWSERVATASKARENLGERVAEAIATQVRRAVDGTVTAENRLKSMDERMMGNAADAAEDAALLETGAKKTPGWEDRHAERYYEEVRNRKPFADAQHIAQHTEFSEQQAEEIRQYVFVRTHILDGGRVERFDADPQQAWAWQRLVGGNDIREMDLVWLRHEHLELTLMRENGYTYDEAHEIANRSFDWGRMIRELMGE